MSKSIPEPPGDDRPVYDLDPIDQRADPAPPAAGSPAPSVSKPGADPLGEKPSLLDDFDEDADFTKDPEVERPTQPPSARRKFRLQDEVVPAPGETIVEEGRGPAKMWAFVGAVLLLAAVIFCAINSPIRPVVNSVLVVYSALVHSVTGVAALAISALAMGLKLGSVDLAAARMFVCVSAFLVCSNLNIPLIGKDARWEELACGALAYVGFLWALFRFDQRRLATVAVVHFLLWVILQMGMQLSVWAEKPLPKGP